jgi:hypothetical protein
MSQGSDERDNQPSTKSAAKKIRDRDAELAMREYQDEKVAMVAKTARLRALRLAKEATALTPIGKTNPKK